MNRFIKIKLQRTKKEFLEFGELLTRKSQRLVGFFLVGTFFLSLPGQNFYQTTRLEAKPPLVRTLNFALPTPASYPVRIKKNPPPPLTAQSAVVLDADSKVVLFAKNPDLRLPPASTTKIMTALVALENYQLADVLEVKALYTEGAQMGLELGEKITVESLLYGLLLNSGNDAAFALAGGSENRVEQFIRDMNNKVAQVGLKNTHFANVTGIEEDNHFSTVWDLAHLAAYAMENPVFAKMVGTKEIVVSDTKRARWHSLKNVNILLGEISGMKGIKTGWTEEAGGCFVAYVERGGRKIIIVVLKSEDEDTRFEEAKALINWTFANHRWEPLTISY